MLLLLLILLQLIAQFRQQHLSEQTKSEAGLLEKLLLQLLLQPIPHTSCSNQTRRPKTANHPKKTLNPAKTRAKRK